MTDPSPDRGPLSERMRLVTALTEINSRHLKGEARRAGAEIALQEAIEAEARRGSGGADAARGSVAVLRLRLEEADNELRALEAERTRLDAELSAVERAMREAHR
jgi:hypothetical protein